MQRVGRTAKSECTQYFSPEIVKKGPTENKAQVRARLHDNPLLPLLSEVELPTLPSVSSQSTVPFKLACLGLAHALD